MTKQEEYEKLLTLKKIFQATFEQTPEITIYEDKHWYLTAEWRFILTFSDQGDLFVMFDDDINPLLSAKIIQCLSEANYQFEIGENYYYSIFDNCIYYGDQIKNKQLEDKNRQLLIPYRKERRKDYDA